MTFDELQARFHELPPLPPTQQLDTWGKHRRSLRNHVATSTTMDDFLRWSTVVATMFRGDCPETRQEWEALYYANNAKWTRATEDPGIGGADRLPYAPHTTGNLVHQAYHLYQWEKATGRRVDSLESIVEFGGGYGAMALVCRQAGFKGPYTIYDLPEFSLLQRYYLDQCKVDSMDYINFAMPNKIKTDLFIACYSISEVEISMRPKFIPADCGAYLMAAADSWDGVDNNEWAQVFTRERPSVKWTNIYNTISPGHWYLIGDKRD